MATMQAIEITRPGAADTLQPTERAIPRPGPGEVLIKVAVAGVNRPDVAQRQGKYPAPPGASDLPGLEVAGELVEGDFGGDNPFSLKPGDAVCALLTGGGYAQYVVAPLLQCLPVPKGLTLIKAAALPENYFTVWSRRSAHRTENTYFHLVAASWPLAVKPSCATTTKMPANRCHYSPSGPVAQAEKT